MEVLSVKKRFEEMDKSKRNQYQKDYLNKNPEQREKHKLYCKKWHEKQKENVNNA